MDRNGQRSSGGFLVWAHRGASSVAAENTLAAFRAAAAAGAGGLELDVQVSRDGVPVVLHDATLDRTTDGRGRVADLTLAELKRFDAGSWFDAAYAGEPIPTLEEVLAWNGGRLRINVEIKDALAARGVVELLARCRPTTIVVSSFDHALLAMLRRLAPSISLAFLWQHRGWTAAVARAADCGAQSFHPRYDCLTPELVAACHRRGMAVYPWTVDEPADLACCRRLEVDGVFCNDPAQVVAWRNREGF